jgi:hypothetical protein
MCHLSLYLHLLRCKYYIVDIVVFIYWTLYLHLLRCKYYIVDIVVFPFFFPCDLGVIIPIGRGGLCKTSKRH